jgi:pimeloyl-ACP methyl ester carboxylesterase
MKQLTGIAFVLMLMVTTASAQTNCSFNWGWRMQTAQLSNQLSVSYYDTGKGQPIVLLHGLGGHAAHWLQNIDGLVKAGHRVIAINLPGYGSSQPMLANDAAQQLQNYASVVQAVVEKLALKKVLLAGHSMGGQIAMLIALQQPKWLEKLALAAPAGLETFTAQEASLLKQYATPAFFKQQDSATIARNVKTSFYNMPASAAALIQERNSMKSCAGFDDYCTTVSAGVAGMLGAPVVDELSQIRVPVLVLFGKQDASIPNKLLHPQLQHADVMNVALQHIPTVSAVWLEEAGHMLQWEQPAAFNNALLTFIHQ